MQYPNVFIGYKLEYTSHISGKHIIQRGIINDVPENKTAITIENLQKSYKRRTDCPNSITWQVAPDMVKALIAANSL